MRVITIGRSPGNDVVIDDVKVSRTHLQLVRSDGGDCSVVDLDSANGTFVNGKRISGEVRLAPHDVIRIGSTTLPWQVYVGGPSSATGREPVPHSVAGTNRMWRYVLACVAVVLLAAGGAGFFLYKGKERARTEADSRLREENRKDSLCREAERKAEETRRLQDEADRLFRRALMSQSDKSKALAETRQKEAEARQKEAAEAKKQAQAATSARREAEAARMAAEKARKEAERAKADAEQQSKRTVRSAEEKAGKAISQANRERDSANEKAKLTEEFYEEYAGMKADFAKRVCKQLGHEQTKGKTDAKRVLKDLFTRSDNDGKRRIVDAIRVARQQNDITVKSDE